MRTSTMACSSRSSAPIASDGICRFATRLVTPRSAIGRSAGCPMRAFERLDHLTALSRMHTSGAGMPRISAQDGLPSIHLAGAGIAAPARMSLSRACEHSLAAPATAALTARLRKRCGGLGSIRHRDASNALSAGPLRFCGFTCHCERSEAISIGVRTAGWRLPRRFARTRNRGFAPAVMGGLGPAIHVFLCSRITRRGWPAPGLRQGKAGHASPAVTVGTRHRWPMGTRNDMKAEPCGGTSLAPWQHIACTCWELGKNARVGPRDRRMSMVGAGPTQLGRCRAYLQAF